MSDAWSRITPDEVIKVGWRTLVRKTFQQPDGRPAEYITKDALEKRAVAVIALTPEFEVVVAEQFRPGPERIMQELPGGGVERDEDYVLAAMRELREETGYTSEDITYLGMVHKDAYSNTINHYYLAKNCHKVSEQALDDGEFVVVRCISLATLLENARSGKMTDTAGVLLAYDELTQIIKEGGYETAN